MAFAESDYLDLTLAEAQSQWHSILRRKNVAEGMRQVDFVPVETLLCLAASYVVDHTKFGGTRRAARAPEPVPQLARLFKRPATSIIAKMANLDGSRPHGAKFDLIAGYTLRSDSTRMQDIYRKVVAAARVAGAGPALLPDFLHLEEGEPFLLLGQDELDSSSVDSVVERELADWVAKQREVLTEAQTTRLLLASVRVGQHRFATEVLDNCARSCVFCGFNLSDCQSPTLLRASHIKPWRDSDHKERLDVANGLAACPTHDAAFDVGLLTVDHALQVLLSPRLDAAVERNDAVRRYFGSDALRERLELPVSSKAPGAAFIEWHRERIYAA